MMYILSSIYLSILDSCFVFPLSGEELETSQHSTREMNGNLKMMLLMAVYFFITSVPFVCPLMCFSHAPSSVGRSTFA